MKTTLVSFKTALLAAASIFAITATARANFDWENLEGDIPGVAEITDQNVINPWGIAVSPSGRIFVADNGAGVATAYFQDGTPAPNFSSPLVIAIPPSTSNTDGANPTGRCGTQHRFSKSATAQTPCRPNSFSSVKTG